MQRQSHNDINFVVALVATATLVLAMGLNLAGVVADNRSLLVACGLTVVIPAGILLFGRRSALVREKVLPQYWKWIFLIALALIVFGGLVRVLKLWLS